MDKLLKSPDRIWIFIDNLEHLKGGLLFRDDNPFKYALDDLLSD